MKKFFGIGILTLCSLLLTPCSKAQGNLQFNQVLKVLDADQTVPSGKVWKVESYHQTQVTISTSLPTSGCSDLGRNRPYFVDNVSYHHFQPIGNGNSSFASAATNEFPLWLKAGQTLRTSCSGDFLSVIEFNVVP
jgi:hypothetical protein